MDRNEKLVHNLWNVHHKMRRLHDGKSSQNRILIILLEHETMTQRDLTEHLHIQPGSASEILFKMEQAGLIVRIPNKSDQRTSDVLLTQKGNDLALVSVEHRKKLYEKMFICLTAEEQDTLSFLLEKLQMDWDVRFDLAGDRHHHERESRE